MSSHFSEPRVELELHPRRAWLWFIVVAHALALAAAARLALPAQWLILLGCIIVTSAVWCLAVYWRLAARTSIHRLIWFGDGRWRITDYRGDHDGMLSDYYLARRFLILKFKGHPAVLLNHSDDDADDARRLRARLKHGRVRLDNRAGLFARWLPQHDTDEP